MEHESDWYVLTTINAPRGKLVTGDDVERWLLAAPGTTITDVDTAGLQAFFYECDLGAQLKFLRGRNIPVERALTVLDQYVRPGFPAGYRFSLDAWGAA